MIARRIVVALDIKNGKVVKGIRFEGLRDAGDPVELAKKYEEAGADEIVFLDIGFIVHWLPPFQNYLVFR